MQSMQAEVTEYQDEDGFVCGIKIILPNGSVMRCGEIPEEADAKERLG